MKTFHSAPVAGLVLALAACSGAPTRMGTPETGREAVARVEQCTLPPVPEPAAIHQVRDVAYAGMDGEPQRLDLAWPRRGGPHPLVVLIHGGGWSGGDKRDYDRLMQQLAGQGYAAATVNYRLAAAPRNTFPAAVEDVRCAVRWLKTRSDTYGIDSARVAALGFSAGAHLAAMLGTAPEVSGLDGTCPLRPVSPAVDAVVAVAGPHDIRVAGRLDTDQRRMVENFLGTSPEADPRRALLASPAVHVSGDEPPFLLIHGTADDLVPIRQSRALHDTLRAAGRAATLIEIPGAGHSIPEVSGDPRFRTSSCTLLAFLAEQLRPSARP